MKRRLALAIAGVAAAAVAMFALPLAVVLERSYRDGALLTLQRDTIAATRGIDVSSGPDRIELPHFNGEIAVYGMRGSLIVGAGPRAADRLTQSAIRGREPTGSTPDGQLVVAVPLLNGEKVTGAVRAQRSQVNVAARAHSAWLALAGLGAGVLAFAIIAALWLGRRLASPLETLAAAARRVGEGDFAARATSTGIPEIDDVASALNSSSQRVGELVERERAFTADASHQLRTPLAALRLELESQALEPSDPAPLAAALVQVDRLQSTIDTLLAVVRHAPTGKQTVDLNDAIRDLEARWHGPLASDGRPLRTAVETASASAAMSPAVLVEILDVLIGNARSHGTGAISVTVRDTADAFAIQVHDQGPGFGPNADEAFQRGTGHGHGIGLALARSLAHSQGARLQISDPGPGPTVSLLVAPAAE
ncbi:MAG: sensor histidine kinase [Solirubrobacteraceae bacterium]